MAIRVKLRNILATVVVLHPTSDRPSAKEQPWPPTKHPARLTPRCGVLGFELTLRYGTQAAFVSAGGYHHHIGLNTWESLGGSPPPPGTTGLYHTAILYPTRRALADALRRVLEASIPLDGASDHGVSEALYLRDLDDNGVELYWDRPQEDWPRTPPRRVGHVHSTARSKQLAEGDRSREAHLGRRRGAAGLVSRGLW
jgi:catechol-2,3-dioxygenase